MSIRSTRLRRVWVASSLWSFGSFAAGVAASTVTTYLMFLAFSHRSSSSDLGRFALVSSVVALVARLVDGVTTQRIAQVALEPGVSEHASAMVRRLAPGRASSAFVGSVVLGTCLLPWGSGLAVGGAILCLGQCGVAFAVSGRMFDGSRRTLLLVQAVNAMVFLVATAAILGHGGDLSVAAMLVVQGLSGIAASLPFVGADVATARARESGAGRSFGDLFRHRTSQRQVASLIALQFTNATTASADSFLAGMGGIRAVADYQLVQRPMLGLGALNTAVGQFALNHFSGGVRDVRRALVRAVPALVVWPAMGLGASFVIALLSPDSLPVSTTACVLLAEAYGLGALSQVTGSVLLLHGHGGALLACGAVQLVVLVGVGVLVVPHSGVVGVAATVLASRAMLVAAQLAALLRPTWWIPRGWRRKGART